MLMHNYHSFCNPINSLPYTNPIPAVERPGHVDAGFTKGQATTVLKNANIPLPLVQIPHMRAN